MRISLRKTSLNDYPGKVSSVFFFSGCNLRCPWCHNPELVLGTADCISLEEGLIHLRKRKSVLGGVVLSGGEPCLYEGLGSLINEIKKLGLPVKLDTNGMCPDRLEELFQKEETHPDYIALDLKLAPSRYSELVLPAQNSSHEDIACKQTKAQGEKLIKSAATPGEKLIRSAELIKKSGIAHEYRTLVLPGGYISEKDIEELAPLTDGAPWFFRLFRGGNCLDPAWNDLEERADKISIFSEALAAKAKALGKMIILPKSNVS